MSIFIVLLPAVITLLVALVVHGRQIVRHELATKERVQFYKDFFTNTAWSSQGVGAYLGLGKSDPLSALLFSVVVFLGLMAIVRRLVTHLENFK